MKHITTLATALAATSSLTASDFLLSPSAHLNATLGASSGPEESLATHAHDPNDEFSLQGIDVSISPQYGEHLAGFINYNAFMNLDNKIDGELEEAFLKLQNLPGGFEFRAGRLLNRITAQNANHLHGWNFVDSNLITPRFLGDEGLLTNSIELSYNIPIGHPLMISAAYGNAVPHDHHHDDEHDHDDHDDDVDDHDDDHHEEIHGEEVNPIDNVFSIRIKGQYNHTDFHQFTYGGSYIHGDNALGKTTQIFGADFQYLWRENGLASGGKHIRATFETIYRDFDYAEEVLSGSASEWGIDTSIGYGFIENWEASLRYGYLEGIGEPLGELPERHRYSAAVTRIFEINEHLNGHLRLQYNHDRSPEFESENAIYLQAQFNFGQGEVR